MMKTRALRREQDERVKARTRRIMQLWSRQVPNGVLDPRQVGVNASTHCRPCACWMCRATHKDIPPLRERPFAYPDLN